jgi:hypothetical protein
MSIKRGQVLECEQVGPHGNPVVAVIGFSNDWAAYERSYPQQNTSDLIARHGDKIGENEARQLFPELAKLRYRN